MQGVWPAQLFSGIPLFSPNSDISAGSRPHRRTRRPTTFARRLEQHLPFSTAPLRPFSRRISPSTPCDCTFIVFVVVAAVLRDLRCSLSSSPLFCRHRSTQTPCTTPPDTLYALHAVFFPRLPRRHNLTPSLTQRLPTLASISTFQSPPVSPSHRTDEDLINRSLLDSIDADVDSTSHASSHSPSSKQPSFRITKSNSNTPIPVAQQVPSVATSSSSPSSASSPPPLPYSSIQPSTTPASSTYSQSNSSQHDPSSPPHFTSMAPSDAPTSTTTTMYLSNPPSNLGTRGHLDALDPSINGSQQYRTSTAFNPAFSTNSGPFSATSPPSHGGFAALGTSPNPSSQQPQPQQHQSQSQQRSYRSDLPAPVSFPSQFSSSQNTYPTKADVFGPSQSLDSVGRYDYDMYSESNANANLAVKQQNYNTPFGMGTQNASTGSALLQSQQVQVSKLPQQGQLQTPAPQQQSQPQQAFMNNGSSVINGTAAYINGVGQGHGQGPPPHHPGMQSSVNGMGYAGPAHGHATAQHPMHHTPGPGPGSGPGPGQSQGVGLSQGPPQGQHPQQQNVRGDQSQEEISTIFVVGFPEDMHVSDHPSDTSVFDAQSMFQEREFQNMFTFSVGFEAATLKIPNKDSSAYGPAASTPGATNTLRQAGFLPTSASFSNNTHSQGGNASYSGSQDPYNLVTVNSGGVVVDGPQGTSSSWQQSNASDQFNGDASHSQPPAMPPRKQIIGFAKFRSRQEALDARDLLQGRRVDIEKGAILKAEMAKKNLHTKRGVGPLGLPLGLIGVSSGVVGPDGVTNVPGLNGYVSASAPAPTQTSQAQPGDPLSARDRELSVLGAMGLGLARRQDTRDDEKDRRDMGQQRPREEEERRRKEKEMERERMERERNNKLRMNNTTVYDAFHSVPVGQHRSGSSANGTGSSSQSTLTPGPGYADPSSTFPGYGFQTNGGGNGFQVNTNGSTGNGTFGQSQFQGGNSFSSSGPDTFGQSSGSNGSSGGSASTWGLPSKPADANNATQKTPALPSSLPARPPSSLQSSPPANYDAPYVPSSGSGRPLYSGSDSSTFSPSEYSAALPPIGPRPRAQSPTFEGQPYAGGASNGTQQGGSSLPPSSSSSVAGSQSSLEGEFSRTLTVSTHQGMTSPQLPSPGSGGSSNNARQGNASDQNPPVSWCHGKYCVSRC